MKSGKENLLKHFGNIIIALFVFGSVVIIRNDIYDGLIIGKYYYFVEIVLLIILNICVYAIFKKYSINSIVIDISDIFIILFLNYSIIHSVISQTTIEIRLCSQFIIIACYLAAKQYYLKDNNKINLNYVLIVFMGFGLYEAVNGIYFSIRNSHNFNYLNLRGSFHNSGIYSIYLSTHLVLAVAIFLQIQLKEKNAGILIILSCLVIISVGIVLFLSFSRTAWVASLVGIMYIFIQHYKLADKIKNRIKTPFQIVFIIAFFLLAGYITALQLYRSKQNSANGRLLIWKIGIRMFGEKPVIGNGFNSFSQTIYKYQGEYFSLPRSEKEIFVAGKVRYAFNDYLQLTIEYGITGLLLFGGFVFFIFYKNKSLYGGVLISVLLVSISSYPLQGLPTMLNFYFILMLCSLESENKKIILFNSNRNYLFWAGMFILSGLLFIFIYKKDKIEKKIFLAEQLYNSGNYSAAIISFNNLYEHLQKDDPNLMVYAKALAMNGEHIKAIEEYKSIMRYISDPALYNNLGISYKAIGDFKNAEKMFTMSIKMIPNLIYPKYLLAKLYIENKEYKKANAIAYEITNNPVKIYSEASNDIKSEMKEYLQQDNK